MNDLKLSIFKDLQSYESKAVGLDTILWWIKCDQSVKSKTELYRSLAKTITREEANKKVKNAIMPAFSVAVLFNGNGKQTTHVTRVTGLSICDIDHVEGSKMEEVRRKILADPHTLWPIEPSAVRDYASFSAIHRRQPIHLCHLWNLCAISHLRKMVFSIGPLIRRATNIMPTFAA